MRFTLNQFEDFLRKVNLKEYREQYQHIKTVEQDLPPAMHALKTLYKVYWDKGGKRYKEPPSFDDFYKEYSKECRTAIDDFWNKSGYGRHCNCFKKGLKARIYRTWASIVTQIHAGYVAEEVFGIGSVEQSVELDHQNIDFQIHAGTQLIKVQVKKETMRREIARMNNRSEENPDIHYIYYLVPQDYNEPKYKRDTKNNKAGDYKEWAYMFVKYFPDEGYLDRFENGFVVFTKRAFEDIK